MVNTPKILEYDDKNHEYKLNGRVLPSVTQMLQAVFPTLFDLSGADPEDIQRGQEHGTRIHGLIEDLFNNKVTNANEEEQKELQVFLDCFVDNSFGFVESESIVFNNDVAGRADIIAYKGDEDTHYILDVKTTHSKNRTKTQYQLSLYKYLYKGIHQIGGIGEIWVRNGEAKYLPLTYKGDEWCNRVIEAYYNRETLPVAEEIVVVEDKLAQVEMYFEQYEAAKQYLDSFRETLLNEMVKSGKNKVQFGSFVATLRAGSVSKRFDSTKFKKDYPDLVGLYEKEVETKPSVVLTKVDKNENTNRTQEY